nr:hypothetical protein [Akkermansia muciniphila]
MATLPPNKSANVRSVLEYVPYFRDKIFAVHVERPLVDSGELVDALLDLDVLQEIGVRPVLIVEGADASALYEHTRVCEMRSALVEAPLKGGQLVRERVREILGRHQIPWWLPAVPAPLTRNPSIWPSVWGPPNTSPCSMTTRFRPWTDAPLPPFWNRK